MQYMERKLNGKLVDDFGYPVLSFFLTIGNSSVEELVYIYGYTHTHTHARAHSRTHMILQI